LVTEHADVLKNEAYDSFQTKLGDDVFPLTPRNIFFIAEELEKPTHLLPVCVLSKNSKISAFFGHSPQVTASGGLNIDSAGYSTPELLSTPTPSPIRSPSLSPVIQIQGASRKRKRQNSEANSEANHETLHPQSLTGQEQFYDYKLSIHR
jgi:hypothetical protein